MRFFRVLNNFIKLALAVAFSLAFCFCVKAAHLSRLSFLHGERTYYLDSASSQSLTKSKLVAWDIFRVQGESVCFTIEEREEKECFARSLVERLGGAILFIEEMDNTISFYAYIPTWGRGIALYGQQVNLHIAVAKENNGCTIGTPIIFGGF